MEELFAFCQQMIRLSYFPAFRQDVMEQYLEYHSFAHMRADAASGRVWVAREGGAIVGTVTVAGGELGRMFVSPQMRGRGVGAQLLREALAYAWETGLKKLTAWSVPFSRGFYEKAGFRMVNADTLDFALRREKPVPYIEMEARPKGEPEISIERALPEDVPEMLAGQRKAFEEQCRIYDDWDIPPMTERPTAVEAYMQAGGIALKAVCRGRIIGAVRGKVLGDLGEIGRLYVLPEMQGRGAARMLVAAMEEAMSGVRLFSIFTGERSEKNIALYQKQGYTLSGKRAPAHPQGGGASYDLVWLEKPNPWPEIALCARRFHGK